MFVKQCHPIIRGDHILPLPGHFQVSQFDGINDPRRLVHKTDYMFLMFPQKLLSEFEKRICVSFRCIITSDPDQHDTRYGQYRPLPGFPNQIHMYSADIFIDEKACS